MNRTSPLFIWVAAAIVLSSGCLALAAQSETGSSSKEVVIEHFTALPQQAQSPGIAFQLYTESGDGNAYLYIEQQDGRKLTILNVTDPAHVSLIRAVDLAVSGPFDFAQPLNESAILLRFRSSNDEALLDLRQPKNPALIPLSGAPYPTSVEALTGSTLLSVVVPTETASASPQDLQARDSQIRDVKIIDTTSPAHPVVLYTARQVNSAATRDATGTTFLLGADGLTIIRRPRVELEYKLQQSSVS